MKKQMNVSWIDSAHCKGKQKLFFGPDNERTRAKGKRESQAKLICFSCPVLDPCRKHAIENPEYGIWGGLTEEDRYNMGVPVADPAVRRRILKARRTPNVIT
jgi:WhiB family redox-sensing transcriptional regulator